MRKIRMMRTFLSLRRFLAILLLLCVGAVSAEQITPDQIGPLIDPALSPWMKFYYENPQPERFVKEVCKMSQSGVFKDPNAQPPCAIFFSQIMAQNPKKIAVWMAALNNLPEADKKQVIYPAVVHSHTTEGAKFLKEKGITGYQVNVPDVLEMAVNNGEILDMLWGYFMATGKQEPIRRIIMTFNLSPYMGALEKFKTSQETEEDKRRAFLDSTLKAARWSLKNNYRQHPRVREICKALVNGDSLNPVERQCLGELIAEQEPTWRENRRQTEDKPNVKSKDGFGALLFLTENKQFFDDWAKPENPHLNPTNTAHRNVPLFTVILFSDPGVKRDHTANVTGEMKVLTPDGDIFREKQSIICWNEEYAVPAHNLQLSQNNLSIRIDPQAPPGFYTIEVTVRDNVKKVELPLKTTFEVPK